VAIPADRNVVQKEVEMKLKYRTLCIKIQRMWNLKCKIIPVIIGAIEVVTKGLKKKWKPHQENIHQITTKHGCTWNITSHKDSTAVGITLGSREVAGRKRL
jgi:hypothetical protein